MFSLSGFWRRHKKKVLVTLGALGTGYAVYKFYDSQRQKILRLERRYDEERRAEEILKDQLQDHFDNIQRISDTTTLPYVMNCLQTRMAEALDLSHLTNRLMRGKGDPNILTPSEKFEIWERVKILSFTRTAASLWAMTMLCLYVRVQVNILGRHLYFETARVFGGSQSLDQEWSSDRQGEQKFLSSADYLSNFGISSLIVKMENATTKVMNDQQLSSPFDMANLQDKMMQILNTFMKMEVPDSWISCLIPEHASQYQQMAAISSSGSDDPLVFMDISKLEQLMSESRDVMSSSDFREMMEISLSRVMDQLIEDLRVELGNPISSIPLARLLPRVAQLSPLLLEEPIKNKYIQVIRALPEIDLFFKLLYANSASAS